MKGNKSQNGGEDAEKKVEMQKFDISKPMGRRRGMDKGVQERTEQRPGERRQKIMKKLYFYGVSMPNNVYELHSVKLASSR